MMLAGLRGAMAYALALQSLIDFQNVGTIFLIVTLLYSLLSVVGIGTIMSPILTKLEVNNKR